MPFRGPAGPLAAQSSLPHQSAARGHRPSTSYRKHYFANQTFGLPVGLHIASHVVSYYGPNHRFGRSGVVASFRSPDVRRRRCGKPILLVPTIPFVGNISPLVAFAGSRGGVPTFGALVTGRFQCPGRPSSRVVL
jgi:hypothetical protein